MEPANNPEAITTKTYRKSDNVTIRCAAGSFDKKPSHVAPEMFEYGMAVSNYRIYSIEDEMLIGGKMM